MRYLRHLSCLKIKIDISIVKCSLLCLDGETVVRRADVRWKFGTEVLIARELVGEVSEPDVFSTDFFCYSYGLLQREM